LLAEAGNYAAFQRLYGGASPYLGGWPYPPQVPNTASPPSSLDLYYRQAAAAAALQKPLPYRLYAPGAPGMNPLTAIPGPSATQFSHLTASNSLTTLSSLYSNTNSNQSSHDSRRSPSPQLNPGSPELRSESNSQSDNDDTIHV
jgi:BarH-like